MQERYRKELRIVYQREHVLLEIVDRIRNRSVSIKYGAPLNVNIPSFVRFLEAMLVYILVLRVWRGFRGH